MSTRHLAYLICVAAALAAVLTGASCTPAERPSASAPSASPEVAQKPLVEQPQKPAKTLQTLTVESAAFKDGESLPAQYTEDGTNVSPPLQWSAPPEGTKAIAISCDDPDAPRGGFCHWILWDVPAARTSIPENLPKTDTVGVLGGAKQGTTDFDKVGYWGPAPPPGKPHHYVFTVYALDKQLDLKPGMRHDAFARVVEAHAIAKGTLTGLYGRQAQ